MIGEVISLSFIWVSKWVSRKFYPYSISRHPRSDSRCKLCLGVMSVARNSNILVNNLQDRHVTEITELYFGYANAVYLELMFTVAFIKVIVRGLPL